MRDVPDSPEPPDDAGDPGSGLPPLDARDRASLRHELEDLRAFQRRLARRGVKGLAMFCEECGEDHYYEWDILTGNLRTLLVGGDLGVHEPAYDPDPTAYVRWEYAQGFVDGADDDAGETVPAAPPAVDDGCTWCGRAPTGQAPTGRYCPSCGRDQTAQRLNIALMARGWTLPALQSLWDDAGLVRLPRDDP